MTDASGIVTTVLPTGIRPARREQLLADRPQAKRAPVWGTSHHPVEGFVRFGRKELPSMTSYVWIAGTQGPRTIGVCDLAPPASSCGN